MPERKRVLLINPMLHPLGEDRLAQEVELIRLNNPDEARVVETMKGVHGVVANAGGHVTRGAIMAADSLAVIAVAGAGYDRVDLEAATERGIPVVNNTGLGPIPVAEHAIGMMIALAKDFRRADRMLRQEGWRARAHYLGEAMGLELNELTLGIIGLGHIGSLTAKKCIAAFDMRVLAYDPYVSADQMRAMGVTKVDRLLEMLPQCDIVTIHAPHTTETHHIIGRQELRAMKPTAYLINCARGPLVDTRALAEALQSGLIAGAGIDVFDPEPAPADHALLGLENALLTPHVAGITTATVKKLALGAAEQVLQVLRGERPPRLVNPEIWDQFRERHAQAR